MAQKIPVLLFISSLLIVIDSFKKFWRCVKQNLLKIVIAWSPDYFIVLMLISYNHIYVNNCTNTRKFLLIAISMVLQSIFLRKTSILVSTIAVDCVMMLKLTFWHPKVVEILTV